MLGVFDADAKCHGRSVVTHLPVILGAVGAIVGLLAATNADDLYSEGGYGKRTLVTSEGAFRLNDKDNIIATTNPINPTAKPVEKQVPTSTQVNVAPSNTQINLNLNGAAIGNANARQDYAVGRNVKAFGGAVDYSASL